ncbi:MAG: cupin domain-containing protein [Sphaerospermopsis kisseleviana]|jgi:mannose-6-phosphate isomerase-like protein (cupin superfamily)|uniref:Cupin domain-containing protein n=1 Tax=Sphaerospermopsis aphanizomenoides LEGE 00250 TaxID=2777972 RepID=A0ABR9VLF8_9CYAN|nr:MULTISPECIES: cupin domain-containing protein [Sphaerospermopsis]MBD2133605.1 cupin domain-containing protein [Sphaerospermopsis sp. FACHB-1094]MBD2145850.1 cupin domain-containing protein [Sphaerospermopsis sp. FACHB-1194]MBE9238902.1 cupin domain-containing protein [Sphaerospermopsis aphanizomenoides LEGE 00250]MEB3149314.1 cupin domain-containing protein [Sphaerospermopsis sp.]
MIKAQEKQLLPDVPTDKLNQAVEFPKLPYVSTWSNAQGVRFFDAELKRDGNDVAPFLTGQFIVKPGATSVTDCHDVREVWIVGRGKGILYYNQKPLEISEGDYLFYDSQESHQVTNTGQEDLVIYCCWWTK